MTTKEAQVYENELIDFITKVSENQNINQTNLIQLIDKHIEIYPDKLTYMGMFDLGDASKSIKAGNILLNQKKFLSACADLVLSVTTPNSLWSYIIITLASLVFIFKLSTKDISENEAYIIAYLHTHNMYEHGHLEDEFINYFKSWYHEKTDCDISQKNITKALNTLYKLKSVAIEDGEIRLKEKVWHNELTQ